MDSLIIENDVLIGKDQELFLALKSRRTVDVMLGKVQGDTKQAELFKRNLDRRRQHASLHEAKYLHLCAPEKYMVYADHLPFTPARSMGEFFLDALGDDGFEYPVGFLRSLLPDRTYRRIDTHWNSFGRLAIAALVANKLGASRHPVTDVIAKLRASIVPNNTPIDGDLGSKLTPPQSEKEEQFRPDWAIQTFRNGLSNGNDGMLEIAFSSHPEASGRLVVFGDSYAFQCIPMLTAFFKEILCCRTRFYHKEIVEAARPDYVMSENAERYFSVIEDDDGAPPFMLVPALLQRTSSLDLHSASALAYLLTKRGEAYLKVARSAQTGKARPAASPGAGAISKMLTSEHCALFERAAESARQARWTDAVKDLEDYLQKEPGDAAGWYELGRSQAALSNSAGAIDATRRALTLDPQHAPAHRALGKLLGAAKRHAEAVESFVAYSNLRPNDAAGHHDLGRALMAEGRIREAVSELNIAVAMQPTRTDAFRDLGRSHKLLRGWRQAAQAFETYLKVKPEDEVAQQEFALILLEVGRFQEALEYFDCALKASPKKTGLRYGKGRALAGLNQSTEAITLLEEELSMHPTHELALLEMVKLSSALARTS
jgi:tetratricopeptide (TPR) repeat protein